MILLLGGTRDAIKIGEQLTQPYIYSIAGVTDNPATPKNAQVRIGGFSEQNDSINGLKNYIIKNNITKIINATHPYASNITNTVNIVSQELDIETIRYIRKEWQKNNDDDWINCKDSNEIKQKLANIKGNVFFTLGAKSMGDYNDLNCYVIARTVKKIPINNGECLVDKGPYSINNEQLLFDKYNFQALVCKNSGGDMNYNKIAVAIKRKIPIIMLDRPQDNSKNILEIMQNNSFMLT